MLREWKLNLRVDLDRSAGTAVYVQIAQALIAEIRRGRLKAGNVLPGTRELAEQLGVNRKTIINVYDELIAQGWLVSEATKGTFVCSSLPAMSDHMAGLPAAREGGGSALADMTEVRSATVGHSRPGVFFLDDGAPDTRLFPADEFARAYRGALSLATRLGRLGYGDPRGSAKLRSAISRMLNVERGLAAEPDLVCLTRGSQMAIYLIARALIRPGDAVIIEELTYPPAREAFRALGADVLSVRIDEDGPDMREVEDLCRRRSVRFIYLTPHHHFPTTRMMRPERRLGLLKLAQAYDFMILEDDYDYEFHFGHQPLLPLASVDARRVIYVGSLSKLLSPHLRVGYVVATSALIGRVAEEIVLIDRQGDQVTAEAVAELIETGELRRHVRKARGVYARRRKRFAEVLREQLPDVVDFDVPEGGLAFWLRFRREQALDQLEARAEGLGLSFLPSRGFADRADGRRGLRIGFAGLDDARTLDVVERLRRGCAGA